MSRLTLVTAPTTEPLTIAEVKAHLRLDSTNGEPAPTAPTVALIVAAGNITAGTHRYLVTFVTAGGETDAGAISSELTTILATHGQVAVSAIPLGGSAVTSRKLYRTAANGSTYLLLTTISNNTATTYTDNLADTSLGAQAPTTNTTADPELTSWLTAARQYCETFTHRAFITQTWDWNLDAFPSDDCFRLPKAPLISVTSVTYVDSNGTTQTVSASDYTVVTPAGPECAPGFIVPAYSLYWPTARSVPNAVTVRFVAGYGAAAAVPAGIKAAMKLLIGHWYERREAVNVGNITSTLDYAVDALLWPYKSF
jgi:uncharacterized phiE125 gp8 family phage protein